MDLVDLKAREAAFVSSFDAAFTFPSMARDQMPFHLAQAAYLGDPALNPDATDGPTARYASWIENETLLHPVLGNREVIVDLIDVPSEQAFHRKYGVTPHQLIELAGAGVVRLTVRDGIDARTPDDVLRSYPLADPHTPSGYVLRHVPDEAVFVGPIRRDLILNRMHPSGDIRGRFAEIERKIGSDHTRLCDLARTDLALHDNIAFRDGKVPHIRAVAWRLVYYEAWTAWSPREMDTAITRILEDDLGDDGTKRLLALAEGYRRLHLFHLMNTAGLTGSWGGQYLITPNENAAIGSVMLRERAPDMVLDATFHDFQVRFASARQRPEIPEMKAFRFNTADGVLMGDSWQAFRAYLEGVRDEAAMAAREKLRKALHQATKDTEIDDLTDEYVRFAELSWQLNQCYFTRFARHQEALPALGWAAGGLGILAYGAITEDVLTSLCLSGIAIIAKANRIPIAHLLCWLFRDQKQSHRDVYGSLETLQGAQRAGAMRLGQRS